MNWSPWFAIVLFGITASTWLFSLLLTFKNHYSRLLVSLGVIISISPLLIFKYYNFVNDTIWNLMLFCGLRFELHGLNWAIPIGISFFTFQAVGYLLDVYNLKIVPERNFLDYILFVSFFPQITSGPISTADELLPQIKKQRYFNYEQSRNGLRLLLWGIFLKVVLADRAGIYVDLVFDNYINFSSLNCLLAAFMYSIQIYGDFAGYSLMAVGVGKLLGFDLINNFNRPYFAQSVTSFWRRWHISLTRWLTQHIYIALGGSRCSKLRQYCNIMITFLVSGIWHGANWTFVIWGILHGFFQIIEKSLNIGKKESQGLIKFCRIIITFLMVTLAWIIFRMPTMENSIEFILQIFSGGTFSTEGMETLAFFFIALIILLLWEFSQEFFNKQLKAISTYKINRWAAYLLIIIIIMLNGVFDGGQFIYANF